MRCGKWLVIAGEEFCEVARVKKFGCWIEVLSVGRGQRRWDEMDGGQKTLQYPCEVKRDF